MSRTTQQQVMHEASPKTGKVDFKKYLKLKLKQNYPEILGHTQEVHVMIRESLDLPKVPVSTLIQEPLEDILEYVTAEGKNLRTILPIMIAKGFVGDYGKDTLLIGALTQEAHEFSKILDDIVDNTDKRHNKDTAHKKYGLYMTLLTNSTQMGAMFNLVGQISDPYIREVAQTWGPFLREISKGELADIHMEADGNRGDYWRKNSCAGANIDNGKIPTLNDYMHMIDGKTSSMLRTSFGLAVQVAGGSLDQIMYARKVGTATGELHQITDDFNDVYGNPILTGKPEGGDFGGHKTGNFVVITLLNSSKVDITDREDLLRDIKMGNAFGVKDALRICNKSKNKEIVTNEYNVRLKTSLDTAKRNLQYMNDKNMANTLGTFLDLYIQRDH
jgi:geranylgeranyl diphosphate synthase, type II